MSYHLILIAETMDRSYIDKQIDKPKHDSPQYKNVWPLLDGRLDAEELCIFRIDRDKRYPLTVSGRVIQSVVLMIRF